MNKWRRMIESQNQTTAIHHQSHFESTYLLVKKISLRTLKHTHSLHLKPLTPFLCPLILLAGKHLLNMA